MLPVSVEVSDVEFEIDRSVLAASMLVAAATLVVTHPGTVEGVATEMTGLVVDGGDSFLPGWLPGPLY
jgi:hypothetical protein